jgi:hypothetical protein
MQQVLRVGMTGIVVKDDVKEIRGLAGLFRNIAGVSLLSNKDTPSHITRSFANEGKINEKLRTKCT